MICQECHGTGVVIGVGCDDREWEAPCPECWKRRAEVAEMKLLRLRMAAQEVLLDLGGRHLPVSRERERELWDAVEASR